MGVRTNGESTNGDPKVNLVFNANASENSWQPFHLPTSGLRISGDKHMGERITGANT